MNLVEVLGPFAGARREKGPRCELCANPLADPHGHVVDLEHRRLCCACAACALLFSGPEAGARFRGVPSRVLHDPKLELHREAWERLGIPVHLAFLFHNSRLGRWVAVFPSPGGPTEVVQEAGWPGGPLGESALLRAAEADVEALLIFGDRGADRLDCLLVPIDRCYELIATVRQRWKGFDGGEARESIRATLESWRREALPVEGETR